MPPENSYLYPPRDRSLLIITLAVVAIHLAAIAFTIVASASTKKVEQRIPQRLVVQTVSLNPQPPRPKTTSLVAVAPTPPPQTTIEPEVEAEEPAPAEEPAEEEPTPPKPSAPAKKAEPTPAPKPMPAPKTPPKPTAEPPKPAPKKPDPKTSPKKDPPKKDPKSTPKPTPEKAAPPKKPAPTPPKKEEPKAPAVDKAAAAEAQKKKEAQARAEKEKQQAVAEAQRKKEAQERAEYEKQQALIAQAQERIANIGKNRDKIGSIASSKNAISEGPKSIASLEIDALGSNDGPPLSDKEISYRQEIAGRLKLQLRLPQYGEVSIKLTLDRTGKVTKLTIVNAESGENKKYIEKTVPPMSFPPFGNRLGSADEYTFSFILRNE